MYCPKCGQKIPNGSRFCCICGADLSDLTPQAQEDPITSDPYAGSSSGMDDFDAIVHQSSSYKRKKKQKGKTGMIVGIAAAAVAVIIAVICVCTLFSGSGKSNAYVYLSDGKYEWLTDLKKGEAVQIASNKSNAANEQLLAFTPDGKYVYYYTKYDINAETGTLCRAEYGKLKDGSAKNDKHIDVISSKVRLGFRLSGNNAVLYQKDDGTLFYFNGKDSVQIAKDVREYYTDDTGKVVYATYSKSGGNDLYGVVLKDIDDKFKLASNVAFINVLNNDFENILCFKYQDEANYELTAYNVGFSKEPEQLLKNANILRFEKDKVFLYTYDSDRDLPHSAYCFSNGELTGIFDAVEEEYFPGGFAYIADEDSDDIFVYLLDGTTCKIPESVVDEMEDLDLDQLYFTSKGIYMPDDYSGSLYMSEIENGIAGIPSIVTDDASCITVGGSILYYVSNATRSGSNTYYDLYTCEGGKSTLLAKEVLLDDIRLFDDGTICARTGNGRYGYELTMFNSKAKATLIGDDITQYIRADKSLLLYVSDGDLYSYNGKDKKRVCSDVDWIWVRNSLDSVLTLNPDDYYFD